MRMGLPAMASLGGAAAFAACGLSLALVGLGLPLVAAWALAGLCAGLLVYALGSWRLARQPAPAATQLPIADDTARELQRLQRQLSDVRHELRGALSPAMMVTDRLIRSEDPKVRRAGETVVRSVERAIALIASDALHAPSPPGRGPG